MREEPRSSWLQVVSLCQPVTRLLSPSTLAFWRTGRFFPEGYAYPE
jgi:hypothetical protein